MKRSPWSTLEAIVVVGLLVWMVCVALTVPCAGSELDEFTRQDRLQHEAAGLVIGIGSGLLVENLPATRRLPKLERFLIALAPALVLGAAKEAYDHRHPERHDCDARDLNATIFGGIVGVSVSMVWRF